MKQHPSAANWNVLSRMEQGLGKWREEKIIGKQAVRFTLIRTVQRLMGGRWGIMQESRLTGAISCAEIQRSSRGPTGTRPLLDPSRSRINLDVRRPRVT